MGDLSNQLVSFRRFSIYNVQAGSDVLKQRSFHTVIGGWHVFILVELMVFSRCTYTSLNEAGLTKRKVRDAWPPHRGDCALSRARDLKLEQVWEQRAAGGGNVELSSEREKPGGDSLKLCLVPQDFFFFSRYVPVGPYGALSTPPPAVRSL